jgi:anti-sigma regulatory factor (Ser/Thr protein kinase)
VLEVICIGSFKSLESLLDKPQFTGAPCEVRTWVGSDTRLISPLVDWLMNLIAASRCVSGMEEYVELALREALCNAMLHGNRLQARKLVRICCCCDYCKGVSIVISDQGKGFDPEMVPDPLAVENLESEHGRGIHLMKLAMDEVSFEHGGTEVRMRKKLGPEQRKCASALLCRDSVR